jgi:large conductance mechanosensitive channel
MLKDFKAFVMRGNVLDLAVAVILGASFGRVVTSLVNDIIMPPLGLLLGKVDFSSLFVSLTGTSYASLAEAQAAGAPTLNYGVFIKALVDFLIVALVIFLMIRAVSRAQRGKAPEAPPAPTTKECPFCCSTISLKATRCPQCTSEL